jgi:hypothetical protein
MDTQQNFFHDILNQQAFLIKEHYNKTIINAFKKCGYNFKTEKELINFIINKCIISSNTLQSYFAVSIDNKTLFEIFIKNNTKLKEDNTTIFIEGIIEIKYH